MLKKIIFLLSCIILVQISYPCMAPGINTTTKDHFIAMGKEEVQRMERFKQFLELRGHIRVRESACRWDVVNSIGAMGYYQFLESTLVYLGYHGITAEAFRKDPGIFPPDMQDAAFKAYVDSNIIKLKKYESMIGKTIRPGVVITRSGIVAAAHLAGPGGVRIFLSGKGNPKDQYGTSVEDYIKEFQGYNF